MHENELSVLQNRIPDPPRSLTVRPALLKLVALHCRLLVHVPTSAVPLGAQTVLLNRAYPGLGQRAVGVR